MGACKANVFRERVKELMEQKLIEICGELNSEYDEVFYVRNGEIYVDSSDFSPIDVKVS